MMRDEPYLETESSSSTLQLWSACLGNFFEHYETALFGFLSPFLAPLIFPNQDLITALILTYAMIPLGMLARPFGALIFGYIGDNYGRRYALFCSLGGMAIVSGCIAFSPTFAQAGFFSPLIFGLGRILQNLLAAGETMGGAIFLLENTEKKQHDFLSSLYNSSTIGGILLASAGVALISHYQVVEWGWRALYLFGCLTGVFGFVLRKKTSFSSLHQDSKLTDYTFSNLFKIFWKNRKSLFIIAISAGYSYANYSVALVLINGFVPMVSSLSKDEMMHLNTALLVLDFVALPFFGWLASKIHREKIMFWSSFLVIFTAIPLFMLLEGATLWTVVLVRICLVLFGVAFFASFHAWAQDLVPTSERYLIISFGYAIGSQIFGGPTAPFSLWLFKSTGLVSSVAWYWLFLAFFNTLFFLKKEYFLPIRFYNKIAS